MSGVFVYVVNAEHWTVPGRKMHAYPTGDTADTGALFWVNELRAEAGMSPAPADASWSSALDELHEKLDADGLDEALDPECSVWIDRVEFHAADLWHVGELPGDDGRMIRDENGLEIARAESRWQADRLVAAHNPAAE